MSLKPLQWKLIEKRENEESWPKQILGASFIYVPDLQKYFLISGNFDCYENFHTNEKMNQDILSAVNKNLNNYYKLETEKVNYISNKIYDNNISNRYIEVYTYEFHPERKWTKLNFKSNVPKSRSFQRCVYHKPYIFCFGGVELGQKGENKSVKELYVLDTINLEWKSIICSNSPCDRAYFSLVTLDKSSILYGGASSPSNIFHEDMWMMKYDDYDFSLNKNEIVKNYWTEITQMGNKPGKLNAASMAYWEGFLYLFGGLNSDMQNTNNLYRFNLIDNTWELLSPKGKQPQERCYHEMSLINQDFLVIYGGIRGTFKKIEEVYNDIFIYSLNDNVWSQPLIGGVGPQPRFGFSFSCINNYKYKSSDEDNRNNNVNNLEIFIFGGIQISNYLQEKEKYFKIYILNENDSDAKHYWTIRDLDFNEEPNDDNFLIQSEKQIHDYKEKIDSLELEISGKESCIEDMKMQIEDIKKQIYKSHGFIDDQSQSLDDYLKDLENQKNKLRESFEYDQKIVDLKMKLKMVMQRKLQRTMDFFSENQNLFVKYYDSLKKMHDVYEAELSGIYNKKYIDEIRDKYLEKLEHMKNRFEKLNFKEDSLGNDSYKFKHFEKSVTDLFKEEIDKYKISEDSLTTENNNQ